MMQPSRQRRPQAKTLQSVKVPAPIGGLNTIDAGSAMPPTDCVYLYNLISAEYGLRARLGYMEWVTGLTGAADDSVRTIIPFHGSQKSGSTDKLFVATQAGIWDCSASTDAPSQLVTFGTQTADAGYGAFHVASTVAGRFLLYCDEENGLYVYPEGGAWAQVASGIEQFWAPNTAYTSGDKVVNGTKTYTCTVSGTSAGSGGPTGTGAGITDNTATWNYVGTYSATGIGPSLADQHLGYAANPANFAHVCEWKGRIYYTEKDTSRAWYTAPGSVYGTVTSFNFGARMQHGGPLVGLYPWSYDAGGGMDTKLVGLSTAGDVAVYGGTDPASASTFGLEGAWYLPGLPYGRRVVTDYGGDVLVACSLGIVPLSKLVVGQPVVGGDRSIYATGKVANLFSALVGSYRTLQGWALVLHPQDNALLVLVPSASGKPTTQLAMSFATKAWSQYRDLPMMCAATWGGKTYFGTEDGRVCVHDGYVDNVLLADPNTNTPVAFSLLTSFQDLGNANWKRVRMLRPTFLSQSPRISVQARARYGFNLLEPDPATLATSGDTSSTWDVATWDAGIWAGDYLPNQPIQGASGIGREVAIAIRGSTQSRTVLVSTHVFFDTGGVL